MVDIGVLQNIISMGESIEREFKADRGKFNDSVLYEEVVAMANTSGGVLLIGVEDNGQITGARQRGDGPTDPLKVQAAIFNNTVPHVNTRVSIINHQDGVVIAVEVDPYPENCATASGKCLRRVIGGDGKPASVPFYPSEQISRRIDLGLMDFSAQVIEGVSFDDLDQLEFERLKQAITRLRGDRVLVELSNKEVAQALRLVESRDKHLIPNVAGLLLLGKTEILQATLPTHEICFHVLDSQGNVKVNESFKGPLLRTIEEIGSRFAVRNEEREVMLGMYRVPIPDYAPEGFREAVNNAVLHRDYSRMEAIYIQWQPDHILITNPGGFPSGINIENLLIHEPKPRNPRLAEAFKRIGLIEQTGRGVDRIYMGQLRYGRSIPDYTRSSNDGVRVVLRGGEGSLQFAAFVFEQDKDGMPLTLDELLALNHVFFERRIDSEIAGKLIQKGNSEGHAVLERLVERHLIEAKGEKRGRVYHLAANVYARLGNPSGYVKTRGFEPIQQEQMILQYIDANGKITRAQACELCNITKDQAYKILKKMSSKNVLEMNGKPPRGAYYIRKHNN